MIRVVLDTNIFISGFLTPKSPPANILTLIVQGRLRLVLSASIASEIKAVLDYPKIRKILQKQGLSKDEINIALARLEKLAIFTLGKLKIAAVEKDPSDNIFLSAAIEAEDFLQCLAVSGWTKNLAIEKPPGQADPQIVNQGNLGFLIFELSDIYSELILDFRINSPHLRGLRRLTAVLVKLDARLKKKNKPSKTVPA
ncbi:putative toxin-antitoxin system toxin component, PIN family [Desulfatiglans anilini]|uniref:putative toxin-antitoxin system toxin component, PIN family n=1 Tax=Desulfatiglans anilini TaxID=90728 RepID=UPI0003F6EB2F|nr:putative toxin-antitoxin system toxin component, PIN family [Desulfatiglans anilini]